MVTITAIHPFSMVSFQVSLDSGTYVIISHQIPSAVRKDMIGLTHSHVKPLHLFVTTVIQPPEKETRLRLRPYSVRRSVHGAQHLESLRVPHHRKSRHPFRQ